MGLNKYGPGRWEDVSSWPLPKLVTEILNIEKEKEKEYKAYTRRCMFLDEQYEIIEKELSRRKIYLDE